MGKAKSGTSTSKPKGRTGVSKKNPVIANQSVGRSTEKASVVPNKKAEPVPEKQVKKIEENICSRCLNRRRERVLRRQGKL